MSSPELGTHGDQRPDDGTHVSHSWEFADEASRLAFTPTVGIPATLGDVVIARDVFKVAVQVDTKARYHLLDATPTWAEITPGAVALTTNKIELNARKASAGTIVVGEVVYQAGTNVGLGIPEVELAQADALATMDAIGICSVEITNTVTGKVMVIGVIENLDTSAFTLNDNVHVSAAVAGEFVLDPPDGPAIHQNIAIIGRSHASLGNLLVVQQSQEPYGVSPEPVNPVVVGSALGPGVSPHASRLDHVHTHVHGIASTDHSVPGGSAGKALAVNAAGTAVLVSPYAHGATQKTGVFTGMELTEATPTTVAISDGVGASTSHANPLISTVTPIPATGITSVAIPLIATTTLTHFLVPPAGGPVLLVPDVAPSEAQYRANVYVGWAFHSGPTIDFIVAVPRLAYGFGQDVATLLHLLGPFVRSGRVTGNAVLNYDIAEGEVFVEGIAHKFNTNNPSQITIAATSPTLMELVFSNGTVGGVTNVITANASFILPGQVEVPLGTNSAIGGSPNQATIQRIYKLPNGKTFHTLGQEKFATVNDARNAAGNELFTESGGMLLGILVARLIVRSGATVLNDVAEAIFIKEGGSVTGGGGGGGVTSFDQLNDTFTYPGNALRKTIVNAAETALEPVIDAVGRDELMFGSLSGAQALNFSGSRNYSITLTGNVNVTALTFLEPGTYKLKVLTGAGGFTLTFDPGVVDGWGDQDTYATSAAAGTTEFVSLYFDGVDVWAQFRLDFA